MLPGNMYYYHIDFATLVEEVGVNNVTEGNIIIMYWTLNQS